MVAAGKKAAITRRAGSYTFEALLKDKPGKIGNLAIQAQEYILAMDPGITENPKKFYIAYKVSQNIACMEIQQKKVILYLKLDPKSLQKLPPIARDVSKIGHFGTGDLEVIIADQKDFEVAKPFIDMAYKRVGG
jgi:predicted transport protein